MFDVEKRRLENVRAMSAAWFPLSSISFATTPSYDCSSMKDDEEVMLVQHPMVVRTLSVVRCHPLVVENRAKPPTDRRTWRKRLIHHCRTYLKGHGFRIISVRGEIDFSCQCLICPSALTRW